MKIEEGQEFQWSQNWAAPIAHTDVNKVVDELNIIQETFGEITPNNIVVAAKNKNSVLHSYFQWDDEKAAHSWRIQQASRLIRNIQVKTVKDGKPICLRAFEISKQDAFNSNSAYKSIDELSQTELQNLKPFIIGDLNRVIRKLTKFEIYGEAVDLIKQAIAIINKDSTETKEVTPPLAAVG